MRLEGGDPAGAPRPRVFVDQGDVDAVAAVLHSGELGSGRGVERFEAALGRALGAPHAVAVASPTAAFQLACLTLGVGPGRRVWMPANAALGAAAAVQACGGPLEFLDVDRTTGNLDARALEERLATGPAPHVLVAAHCAGSPCELEWLLALKRRHDFDLLEDATEALGARQRIEGRWFRVGEHPEVEASIVSFEAGAIVTTGHGAAVSTHSAARAAQLARLRELGGGEPPGAWAGGLGLDCALGDLPAALGVRQLETLSERAGARRELAQRYLDEVHGFGLPRACWKASKEPSWQRFLIGCEAEERDALRVFLAGRGIAAETLPSPLPLLPWFQARALAEPCPNAAARARSLLGLPIHAALSHAEQGRVIAALAEWTRLRRAA